MTEGYKIKKIYVGTQQVRPVGWQPTANTLAYYPLKIDTKDYSGNSRDGTNNGVTFSNNLGVFNGSANIDLGTADWTKLQTYSNFTISVWFKRTGTSSSLYNCYIIGKARMHPAAQSNILFGIGYNGYMKLVAGVFPGNDWSPTPIPYGSSIDVNIDTWYNIVLVKSGTTKTVYINGASVGTGTAQDTTSTDNPPLTIGSVTYYNSASYVIGNISEVIMENKARTSEEISSYYNQTKSTYGL